MHNKIYNNAVRIYNKNVIEIYSNVLTVNLAMLNTKTLTMLI